VRTLGSHNANLSGSATTFARACLITRVDGTAVRFADIQASASFGGNTFTAVAGIGFASLPFQANAGATRADVEIAAAASGALIDSDDVRDGLYDSAQFIFYLCDHATPANGLGTLFAGTIGEVKMTDRGAVVFECVGLLGKGKTIIVEHRTPVCRNWLYDANCRVVEATYKTTTTVASASGFNITFAGGDATDHYYKLGFVRFLSGASEGRVYEIRSWNGGTLTAGLYLPLDAAAANGDSVELLPGCDYSTGAAGCGKFIDPATGLAPNILNFRGEPTVPGQDARSINYSVWGGS
jgi:uncharacterized phage protein (TIGR02218 family)